jgi:hypothetical protein
MKRAPTLDLIDAINALQTGRLDLQSPLRLTGSRRSARRAREHLQTYTGQDPVGRAVVLAGAALLVDDRLGAARAIEAATAVLSMEQIDALLAPLWDAEPTRSSHASPLRSMTVLRDALSRSDSVVRIESSGGRFYGSGVLVRSDVFMPGQPPAWWVLTCAHVCSADPGPLPANWPTPINPAEARVIVPQHATPFTVRLVSSAAVQTLDASVLALVESPTQTVPIIRPSHTPIRTDATLTYMMGYPEGRPLEVALEGKISELAGGYLRYSAAGEPGCSGGPVFHWQDGGLLALHRGERPRAREAVLLDAIMLSMQHGV